MRNLISLILIIALLSSCASTKKVEYDYYYFSWNAYQMYKRHIESGVTPRPTITSIDGVLFTCNCPPDFVDKHYKPNFPDVVLVKKVTKRNWQNHYSILINQQKVNSTFNKHNTHIKK